MLKFTGVQTVRDSTPSIKVVGVGGGGGNVINRMIDLNVDGVEYIAANTDLQDLKKSKAPTKLQLGAHCTQGLGAGAKPEIGRSAALESMDHIREVVSGADMVFVTAGLGGGTGTGGMPVVAQVAKEVQALTVGVVTLPFNYEGKRRCNTASEGVEELRKCVDTLIVIPNNNLLHLINKRTSMLEAFGLADDVLRQAIQGVSDLITRDGIVNLDFADVRTVMENKGKAVMGSGTASGENRALKAAEQAIRSPLLSDRSVEGARGILMNVVGDANMTLHEITEASDFIQQQGHPDAVIIWGASINEELTDHIMITVIATGFDSQTFSAQREEKPFVVPTATPTLASEPVLAAPIEVAPEPIPQAVSNELETKPAFATLVPVPQPEIQEEPEEELVDANSPAGESSDVIIGDLYDAVTGPLKDEGDKTDGVPQADESLAAASGKAEEEEVMTPPLEAVHAAEVTPDLPQEGRTPLVTAQPAQEEDDSRIAPEPAAPPENGGDLSPGERLLKQTGRAGRIPDVQTEPMYPTWAKRSGQPGFQQNLDIPAFIRRRKADA